MNDCIKSLVTLVFGENNDWCFLPGCSWTYYFNIHYTIIIYWSNWELSAAPPTTPEFDVILNGFPAEGRGFDIPEGQGPELPPPPSLSAPPPAAFTWVGKMGNPRDLSAHSRRRGPGTPAERERADDEEDDDDTINNDIMKTALLI